MKQLKYILIIAMIMLVLSGCIADNKDKPVTTPVPTPVSTPIVTVTGTVTPVSEATPTGNVKLIELDRRRGFNPAVLTIEPGDGVIWSNIAVDTTTLVSDDGLFNDQILAYYQQYKTIFRKTGIYKFHLENNTNLNGTVIVEIPSKIIQTPSPTSTGPKELPAIGIFVEARLLKPAYWSPGKYELSSLKVGVTNQLNQKLTIKAQILNDNQLIEERSFILEHNGNSYQFTNEKNHFINSTNVTLRLLVDGYLPADYPFRIVDSLS